MYSTGYHEFVNPNITFTSGSYSISEVNDSNMVYIVNYLNDFPSVKIRVEGHTDSDGGAQFNLDLSRKRAESVKKWLIDQGIQVERISTIGYGKSRPIRGGSTAEEKAVNRRVEIQFIKSE
ncbi:MAG: OmpA family protein [Saprospiraceae bacterium]